MRDRGGGLELDPLEQSLAREQGAVQRSTVENGSVVGDQLCAAGLAPSAAASATTSASAATSAEDSTTSATALIRSSS